MSCNISVTGCPAKITLKVRCLSGVSSPARRIGFGVVALGMLWKLVVRAFGNCFPFYWALLVCLWDSKILLHTYSDIWQYNLFSCYKNKNMNFFTLITFCVINENNLLFKFNISINFLIHLLKIQNTDILLINSKLIYFFQLNFGLCPFIKTQNKESNKYTNLGTKVTQAQTQK